MNKLWVLAGAPALLCVGGLAAGQRASEPLNSRLSLGKPAQVGAIAVVPILRRAPVTSTKYMTLAEAMKAKSVEIVEIPGQAEVNSLEVRNKAKLPLMLVAGELLLGGKQDRIVAKDVIVPALESRRVPVFCVEHGRWDNKRTSFVPSDTLVPETVRARAVSKQSQREVWDSVAQLNAGARVAPATGTVQATLADPRVAKQVEETSAMLEGALKAVPNAVGVICWLDGKVHSADVFASADLFAANRRKLLRSYCADLALIERPKSTPVDMKAVAQFLEDIGSARRAQLDKDRHNARYGVEGKVQGYEAGEAHFAGGAAAGGFGHGNYRPGK